MWDYDLPAAPVLCNIKVDGKQIKAVAQISNSFSGCAKNPMISLVDRIVFIFYSK